MKIKYYILGLQRNFRGMNLVRFLESSGAEYEIVWGLDASKDDSYKMFRDEEKSLFFYGRNLTPAELACTSGHKIILEKSKADNVDFAVVLEDDASIIDLDALVNRLHIVETVQKTAIFLLLYNKRLCLQIPIKLKSNKSLKIRRIFSNPSPASAYVLNRLSINTLTNLPDSVWEGVQADFPPIFFDVLDFYSMEGNDRIVSLHPFDSTIGERLHPDSTIIRRLFRVFIQLNLVRWQKSFRKDIRLRGFLAHFIARRVAWKLSK